MKKITCYACLLAVLASCQKESQPAFKDFRFVDHIKLLPIQGVHVESKGICIVGSNGNQGTCSSIYPYTGITGSDGMVRFADVSGNRLNTKHPLYYDLERTENPFPSKNEYHLFLKAEADLLLRYPSTDISDIYIVVDAPDRIDYLDKSGPISFVGFFNSAENAAAIQLAGNQAGTYVDLLGGIDNDIRIITSFSSGATTDTVVRVRSLPNQTMALTVNFQ